MKNFNMNKVFVYGYFQFLHPGHVRFLSFAKSQGEYLVVGLLKPLNQNIDEFSIEDRVYALNNLVVVDEVIILEGDVGDLITDIKPSTIVMGPEFQNKEIEVKKVAKSIKANIVFGAGPTGVSLSDFGFAADSQLDNLLGNSFDNYLKRSGITVKSILNTIEKFKNLRILVAGDSIVDCYTECRALGMSQEDPLVVTAPVSQKKFVGGAGIIALHAASLTASVDFFTAVGGDRDEAGSIVKSKIRNANIQDLMCELENFNIVEKKRFRVNGSTVFRHNIIPIENYSEVWQKKLIKKAKNFEDKYDLVIFADFSLGMLSPQLIKIIKSCCKNAKISADSQYSSQIGNLEKFEGVDYVFPTEFEARSFLHDNSSGLSELSNKVISRLDNKITFLKLGSDGVLVNNVTSQQSIPSFAHNVKDVAGAGDSLMVGVSLALCTGASPSISAVIGSLIAAIQISRVGNVPVTAAELIATLQNHRFG